MNDPSSPSVTQVDMLYPEAGVAPNPVAARQNSHEATVVVARIGIHGVNDIVQARLQGRMLSHDRGFTPTQSTLVATVISELARNIILYAQHGEIILSRLGGTPHDGIEITAVDNGPGIVDTDLALVSGYSSSGGLGLGLPGVRQMADSFEISSRPDNGTKVTVEMWSLHPRNHKQD